MKSRSSSALLVAAFSLMVSPLSAVDIVAHRGASFDAPENTLAAEKLAWQQGTDAVETDIQLTKDGRIIVCHDLTAKRTTGREGKIVALTFDELRALDAGVWKNPKFAGEKLPTLDEQIALIPAGKRMLVEIKVGPEIVPELQRCLQHAGASEKTITFISFKYESLQEVRKVLPRYQTLYLASYKAPDSKAKDAKAKKQPTIDELIEQAKAAKLTGLDLQHTWPLTPGDVKRIKAAGLQLHVWTVDDVEVAKRWVALGAASITTNRPGWLREQLKP
jgi:glycerophosphoryl diester phosphodiesterase